MSKIVKIKQKDIENIVKNIVTESIGEYEKLDSNENSSEPYVNSDESDSEPEVVNPDAPLGFFLVQDENGNVYAINTQTGEILDKK
jgi:hypothetical protein